ncbi:uncharacterized protein TNCV_830491 [Trichonephila clavipes]|nr:uncharacterized protein TNCV_830491 [Trichonephila clavipes]
MCSNITTQHIKDLKLVSALSIAVDESSVINDTAQVSLFARFMFNSSPKEELLGLLPLKGQTRGEDIANAVTECTDKHIPLDKIESISTDGGQKHSLRAGMASCLSGTSVSLASQPKACLKRKPVKRRKRCHALRSRETRDGRKVRRRGPRETRALKRRAREITG